MSRASGSNWNKGRGAAPYRGIRIEDNVVLHAGHGWRTSPGKQGSDGGRLPIPAAPLS